MSDYEKSIQEAQRMAQTPEGKQLFQLLQQIAGPEIQQALDAAAAGNTEQAKQLISTLMRDPRAKQILKNLGGIYGK